jgi:hypothetical protein
MSLILAAFSDCALQTRFAPCFSGAWQRLKEILWELKSLHVLHRCCVYVSKDQGPFH